MQNDLSVPSFKRHVLFSYLAEKCPMLPHNDLSFQPQPPFSLTQTIAHAQKKNYNTDTRSISHSLKRMAAAAC